MPKSSTPTTLQPLETRYAGCRFRSRLEARWALLFDILNLPWEYEPETFGFGKHFSLQYTPDFHVSDSWVEIKPLSWLEARTGWEKYKTFGLTLPYDHQIGMGKDFMILLGLPGEDDHGFFWDGSCGELCHRAPALVWRHFGVDEDAFDRAACQARMHDFTDKASDVWKIELVDYLIACGLDASATPEVIAEALGLQP